MPTIRVNFDLTVINENKQIFTTDEGCGCCSDSKYLSAEELLLGINCAIKELNKAKKEITKFIEDRKKIEE